MRHRANSQHLSARIAIVSAMLPFIVAACASAPNITPLKSVVANSSAVSVPQSAAPPQPVTRTVRTVYVAAPVSPSEPPLEQPFQNIRETIPAPPTSKPAALKSSSQSLAEANKSARLRPADGLFEGATLFYPYQPGALYELHTSPSYVSTVLLEPGEALIDIAAADTVRWTVSNTVSGAGDKSRTLIIVKPNAPKLKTNIVLVTDKRSYLIEATSTAGDTYTAQLAWRYPAPPAPLVVLKAEPLLRPINTNYIIRASKKTVPAWKPLRAYDDGLKTWIVFPDAIAASDMPPLFIKTGEGLELVNYRIEGNTYEVDRLFDEAELRIGRVKPVVVRIVRDKKAKGAS
jgi:type IV secretion system protein TrbG